MNYPDKTTRDLIRLVSQLSTRVQRLETGLVDQQNIVPKGVKNRHIDGIIIESGMAANRPDGTTHTKGYFETDTNRLCVWNSSEEAWKCIKLGLTDTYTLTNVTTDRNLDADAAAVAETNDVLSTLIQDLGGD